MLKSLKKLDLNLAYTLFCILLFIISLRSPLHSPVVHISLIIALIPIAYVAFEKLKSLRISTELFLVIASIISFIGHEERAINLVLIIMLVAEYLQKIIERRTRSALSSLIKLIPSKAVVKTPTAEKEIPLKEVTPGMLVIINTGQSIGVDGIIVQGKAEINESSLTGESTVKIKQKGQEVLAGTFVESGSILVKVNKVGSDTFFGKITFLVEQAENKKANVVLLADKVASILVPILLLFFIGTWIITGDIKLVITLLVFGSPFELTLITPLSIFSGVIAAFKQGILVKGGIALEKLAYSNIMIFDKTGTLTAGEPEVVKIEILDKNYSQEEIIKIAAIADKRSGHVLAKSILSKAKQLNITVPDPDEYISISGHGVEIVYNNQKYFLGNKHFIEAPEHANIHISDTAENTQDYSSVYLADQDNLCAIIYISDAIRPEAYEVIQELKKNGLKILLVSGDKESVVSKVAKELKIDKAYWGIFPDEKLSIIKKLQQEGNKVTMVGDGINDAPALKQADVGIAMGAMGMEPAIDAADLVLMSNDITKIFFLYKLSKKVLSIIKQNIFIGFLLIHSIGITLAFLNLINPIQAALFHAIPDLLIMLNSARLVNFSLKKE